MKKKKIKILAVMTGGGDCPGLNAAIRAVVKTAINENNLTVMGVQDGFLGLIERRMIHLTFDDVSNILTLGGTILGSNNTTNPFRFPRGSGTKIKFHDFSDNCIDALKFHHVDALVCIGGDGTMASAANFAKKGLAVIGIPKTIDNDVPCTDSIGFDTAVKTAAEAIDKIHDTASSHHRVMIVELMGRYVGWLALYAGVASGADVILIPELPYKLDRVCDCVIKRSKKGRKFSIIAVAEGAHEEGKEMVIKKKIAKSPDPIRLGGIANRLAEDISRKTGLECRPTILGYVQRGGTPTPADRVLATSLGHKAVELLMNGEKNQLVVFKYGKIFNVPLSKIAGKIKKVPLNHLLINSAKAVGTSFGR